MGDVYLMDEQSNTSKLRRIHCINEDKELQLLLEKNLELLLGDQISPAEPCQWLLIKREMPVTDPSTGLDRWSIDFFLTDQSGIPTLVECKRCNDSRSRREVIGQMFEYAANGHHYWDSARMQAFATASNGGETALRTRLDEMRPEAEDSPESYFSLVERNLRSGKMRLIFFLEDSPLELRSMVEFLSGQLQDTQIFLVEARQFEQGSSRIVVPWLFGFSDEIRVAARKLAADNASSSRPEQGEENFWNSIEILGPQSSTGLRQFISQASTIDGCQLKWFASCVFMFPKMFPRRGLFGIRRTGELEIYFGYWEPSKTPGVTDDQQSIHREFSKRLQSALKMNFSDKQLTGYPRVRLDQWLPRATDLIELVRWTASMEIAETNSAKSVV